MKIHKYINWFIDVQVTISKFLFRNYIRKELYIYVQNN